MTVTEPRAQGLPLRSFLDRFVGNLSPSALMVSTFFWSWFDLVPFSPLLPQAAMARPLAWVPVASVLLGAVALAAYALSGRLRSLSLKPSYFAGASLILGGAGSLALYGGFATGWAALLVAGTVLTGLYQGVGAAVVGCVAVCQGKTNALIHIAACLPFNVVFVLLGMFLQPGAAVVLCALLPLLSALSYQVFLVRGTNAQNLATMEKTPQHSARSHREHPRYGGYVVLLILVTAAFGFMEAQDPATARDAFGVAFLDYASLLIRGVCALAVFCAYVFYSKQPQTFLVVAIALIAAGLLALGPTAALGPVATVFSHLLVLTGYAVFDLLIWAMLVIVHHGSALSMRRFLCIAYAIDGVGISAGMALAVLLPQQSWIDLAAMVLGGALLAVALLVLGRPHSVRDDLRGALPAEEAAHAGSVRAGGVRSGRATKPGAPFGASAGSGLDNLPAQEPNRTGSATCQHAEAGAAGSTPAHVSAVNAMATRYFLTEREAAVLGLLLAGRSAPYIAEQLCVSQNTVKTHVRHIYAKLDIHTRQELLDLVQEQEA